MNDDEICMAREEHKDLIALRQSCRITGDFGNRWMDDNIAIEGIITRERLNRGFMLVYDYAEVRGGK